MSAAGGGNAVVTGLGVMMLAMGGALLVFTDLAPASSQTVLLLVLVAAIGAMGVHFASRML